ncbi:MAG TPA: Fic family protein [Solirubrobacterales bacterium]|nr:Fic family protein [Solirubrobacterales bacterium]
MEDLHFAGQARKFLDNLRPSRTRGDGVSRTLSRAEIEDELTRIAAQRGTEALNELRDRAEEIAPALGAEREMAMLDDLIGAVQGTRDVELATAAARAQRQGMGFDPRRLELFETLQAHLLQDPQPERSERTGSLPALSFIEAYFSNWIEGTEFAVDEAEEIVFEGAIPDGRFEDAHDVLGTFELVNDGDRRARTPRDADELLALLRSHHGLMLARRPAARPGFFKAKPNQAGGTTFVHPDLVEGTLREGFRYLAPLPSGLSRAIFMMFLVSEVHPFTDGNGRVARVLMNAELTATEEQRIVIPLSYRDDYLQSLRALSRSSNPRPLVRVLDFAQQYAAAIDWSDLRTAKAMLTQTNAFVPPDVAEEKGLRLRLPENPPA